MGKLEYFPAFFGYLDSLAMLTDAQIGRVFIAALKYARDGEIVDLDPVEAMAFAFIKGDIDRAKNKYDEKCERLRANGMRGGRPPSEKPDATKRFSENQKEPEEPIQNNTKQNNTKQYNTNDIISASDDAKPTRAKAKRFSPPSVEDVAAYCAENGYGTIDPAAFVDYYEARGWKIGSQSMKDWRATVRNWARRDKGTGSGYARREESGDPFLRVLNEEFAKEMAKNEQSGNSGRAENPADGLSGLLFPAAR